jgi:hypothetical protein
MSMPGFAAEASLGTTKESYTATLGHSAADGSVLPQSLYCTEVGFGCEQCTYCTPRGGCIHYVRCPWSPGVPT